MLEKQNMTNSKSETLHFPNISSLTKISLGLILFTMISTVMVYAQTSDNTVTIVNDSYLEENFQHVDNTLFSSSPGSTITVINNDVVSHMLVSGSANSNRNSNISYDNFLVCEFDPNYHSNLSDAMESNSLLPINQSFDYFMLDSTATSFQYPILGAESLREGKYYVWQLKRSYETTVGEESLFSDIFVFKLHSFQGNAVNSSTNLEVIKGIVGEDQYRILFGSNGELSSFTSGIALVTLDGEEIPISQLYEILSKVEQSQINILEVKSE